MIITKSKPYAEIKKALNKDDKIGLVSCNMCARICHTGGKKAMEKLADKLEKDGFQVVDLDLIGSPCVYEQLQATDLRGEVTLVLACEAGVKMLEKVFPQEKLIPALQTVGIGMVDETGEATLVKEIKE